MAGLAATLWIPAFAGMMGAKCKRQRNDSPIEFSVTPLLAHTIKGEGIRWMPFMPNFG